VPGVLDEIGRSIRGEYCPFDRIPLHGACARVVGCGWVGLGDPIATIDVAGSPLGLLELDERSTVSAVVAVAGAKLRKVLLAFGRRDLRELVIGERVRLVADAVVDRAVPEHVEIGSAGSGSEMAWDLVFCQPNGRPIDPRADWAGWGVLLQRAGVRQVRVHDGRHTAATLLLEQGVHVRAIQRILGRSDVRTTEAYTHVGDEVTREAARRMGAALWGE
jgi:hypothetical protein